MALTGGPGGRRRGWKDRGAGRDKYVGAVVVVLGVSHLALDEGLNIHRAVGKHMHMVGSTLLDISTT